MADPDTSGPTTEFAGRRPAPSLRGFVTAYIGYREAGVPPARHRGLPSPYLTMIVTLDDPLVVAAHADRLAPPGTYDTLVGGLHSTPALITHDGRQSGIQLALTPLGARALLGLPAGELSGIDLDGADVLGGVADELRERLLAATGWPERFAVLDSVLVAMLGSGHGTALGAGAAMPAEVTWAWRRLLAASGGVGVSDLAREVGWSTRYLGRRFREEIGLSPKEAARVVRFDHARRTLQRLTAGGAPPALASLAANCGYYDQAHLAREFGALAGCSPSRWLAEEFRNVQALPPGAATDLFT
ncbi:AraC family transcriptional regulator [Microtetraspora sp. AC03309]|uniref:AraC family transcriptional regulator n=1 Tax=Microtetraspora sp. AC03309 TaxID=2779376 RepID=UPI001E4A8E5A|nr:helix-turn-helix domain-containing protein [Microtetraspora sp. AC03309]MCC5575903.1 AraC family transcriptional regulator [Microtetraspora sp. AC03309]